MQHNPTEGAPPLVSVIVPVFNAAQTLEAALSSVILQTYRNLEIIVVDDASTDATAAILSRMAALDCRVRSIKHDRNLGPAAARNSGISRADGDFCAFIDSDDLWEPQKLELQIAALRANPRAVICCCNAVWERDGVAEGTIYDGCFPAQGSEAWKSILADCYVGTPCAVVTTRIARELGCFDTRLSVGEDQDFWLRMSLAGEVIALPDILVRYRRTPTSYMERNRQLSAQIWLPRLEEHIVTLSFRLTQTELRLIRRARYFNFARNLYRDGDLRQALQLFGRALCNGAPWQAIAASLMSESVPVRLVKTWLKRRPMPKEP